MTAFTCNKNHGLIGSRPRKRSLPVVGSGGRGGPILHRPGVHGPRPLWPGRVGGSTGARRGARGPATLEDPVLVEGEPPGEISGERGIDDNIAGDLQGAVVGVALALDARMPLQRAA